MSLCAKNPVASENVPSYERRGSPEETERGAALQLCPEFIALVQ